VLQLPASSVRDYDVMADLEKIIRRSLGNLGRVDGHDAGSGETNIFILTNHPKLAFGEVKRGHETSGALADLKVAYREVGQNGFNILHPADLTHFAVA
jgi:hypothetical protein